MIDNSTPDLNELYHSNKGLSNGPELDPSKFNSSHFTTPSPQDIAPFTVQPYQETSTDRENLANQTGFFGNIGKGLYNSGLEVTLGTLRDTARLLDVQGHIDSLLGTETEFSNWFSDAMIKAQKDLGATINTSDEDQGFSPLSSAWWGNNLPNIANTLSMMIPTLGAVEGMSGIAKTAGLGKLLKTESAISSAKGLTGAIFSRLIENTSEAHDNVQQAYQHAYGALKAQGLGDDEADRIAKETAGEVGKDTWYKNSLLLGIDAFQYGSMFKSFNAARRASSSIAGELVKQIPSEAGEEVYQYLVGKEGQYDAEKKRGIVDYKSMTNRYKDYLTDPDLYTAAFLGGLGGGVFTAGFEGAQAVGSTLAEPIKKGLDKVLNTNLAQNKAAEVGDKKTFYDIADDEFMKMAISKASEGKLGIMESEIKAQMNEPNPENLQLNPDEFKSKMNSRLDDLKYIEDNYNRIQNDTTKSKIVKDVEMLTTTQQRLKEKRLSSLNNDIENTFAEASATLNPTLSQIKRTELEIKATAGSDLLKGLQDTYKKTLEGLYEQAKSEGLGSKAKIAEALKTSYDKELEQSFKDKKTLETELGFIKDVVTKAGTPTGKKEIEKEVENNTNNYIKDTALDILDKILPTKTNEQIIGFLNQPLVKPESYELPEGSTNRDVKEFLAKANKELATRKSAEVATAANEIKSVTPDQLEIKKEEAKNEPEKLEQVDQEIVNKKSSIDIEEGVNREHIDNVPTDHGSDEGVVKDMTIQNEVNPQKQVAYNDKDNPSYAGNSYIPVGQNISFAINPEVDFKQHVLKHAIRNDISTEEALKFATENLNMVSPIEISADGRVIGFVKALYNQEMVDNNPEIASFRKEIYESKKEYSSTIKQKGPGWFNNVELKNKSLSRLDKTETLFETLGGDLPLGYGLANGIVVPNHEDIQVATSASNLTNGSIYVPLVGVDGKIRPAKLLLRRVDEAEVNYVIGLLNALDETNATDTKDKINEVVYIGSNSGKNDPLNFFDIDPSTGSVQLWSNGTVEDFPFDYNFNNDEIKANIANRLRNVLKSKLNNFDQYTNAVNGQVYDNYNTFLSQEYVLTSDLNSQYKFRQAALIYDLPKAEVKEQVEPKVEYRIPDTKPSRDKKNFLRRSSATDENFKHLTEEGELKWLEARLPFVNAQMVNDLREIDSKFGQAAWGLFADNMIYFAKNAPVGTVAHEAFHTVFNLILNEKEKRAVLDEAKNKYGLGDVSNLKELYPEATDNELNDIYLEEKLAEDFKRYSILDKGPKSLGEKISNFFKRLNQILKNLLSNKITLDEFFYRIDSGIYKRSEKLFIRNVNRQNQPIDKKQAAVPGFTIKLQKKAVETIDDMFIDALGETIDQYEKVNNLDEGSIEYGEYLTDTKYDINKVYARALYNFINKHPKLNDLQQKLVDMYDDMDVNGETIEGLKTKHKRFLSVYGYNLVTPDSPSIDDTDEQKERWQYQYFTINGYDKLSSRMKRLIRTMRVIDKKPTTYVDDNGNKAFNYHYKVNEFGEFERVNFHETYNFLVRNLAGLDTYENMLEELNGLSNIRPELHQLVETLNESNDEFRSEFYTHFSKSNNKFLMLLASTQADETGDYKKYQIFTSNRRNVRSFIKEEWKNKFIDKYIYLQDNNTYGLRIESLSFTKAKFKNLKKELEATIKAGGSLTDDLIGKYIEVLHSIGINVPEEVFNTMKGNIVLSNGAISNGIHTFASYVSGGDLGNLENIISTLDKAENPFTGIEDKSIDRLVQLTMDYNRDVVTDSFKNIENKSTYSYNMNTFMTKFLSKIKSDENNEILKIYLADPYYKNSRLVKRLIADNKFKKNSFDLFILDGIKNKTKGEAGTKYADFNEVDSWTVKINAFLNNGNKELANYTLPTPSDNPVIRAIRSYRYNEDDITQTYVDQVIIPELKRIVSNKRNPLDIKSYKKNSLLLLSNDSKEIHDMVPELTKTIEDHNTLTNEQLNRLKEASKRYLLDQVRIFNNKLLELGIITKNNEGVLSSDYVDSQSVAKAYNGNLERAISRFYINSLIFNSEFTRLGTGDVAFYKDVNDASKRSNEYNVPGEDLNVDVTGKTYKLAILKTEKIKSPHFGNSIDYTDAQGYMTLDRWIKIVKATGKWNTKLEASIDRLKNGEPTEADYNIILNPVKGFYYGHTFNEKLGIVVPTQIKYSAVPLIPILTKDRPELQKLMNTMEANNIDEAVFDSGVKSGETNTNSVDNFLNNKEVQHIELENAYWRWVQNVPEHHLDQDILVGTQIRRLIIENVLDDTKYNVKGKEFTGKELKDLYQKLIVQNVEEDLARTTKEFDDINTLIDQLKKEVDTRGLDSNYEDSLRTYITRDGKESMSLPWSLITRFEPILSSIFKNGVMQQKTRGIAAVQVSKFGFQSLKYVDGPDGYAECLLPFWTKSFLQEGDIDPELLKILGYRIPTEGKHSMIPLRVVGFLPQESGSIIVMPEELIAQMGSDFDIDKMYIMLKNFKKEGEKLVEDSYNFEGDNTREQRDNGILDIMSSILTNNAHTNEIIKEGGFKVLQDLAKEVRSLKNKPNLLYIDPLSQEEFRKRNQAGATLIGQAANQNTNHALAQDAKLALSNGDITFDSNLSTTFYNVEALDGTLISENLGQFLAAFVDNAKDPVADDLNINMETFPVAATIVRAGYSLETATMFTSQPIIEDWVKFVNHRGKKYAKREIAKKYNIKSLEEGNGNLNTEDLKKQLKIPTNEYQQKVFENYLQYSKYSSALGLAVSATRADAIKSLPTLAELGNFLRKVRLSSDNYLVPTKSIFEEDSTYPMTKAFTKALSVTKDKVAEHIPYGNNIFESFLDVVKDNGNVEDGTFYDNQGIVNNSLISFMATDFDWLKERLANRRSLLIGKKTLAKRVNKLKQDNDNLFLKLLSTPDYHIEDAINYINFSGTVGYSSDERNEIIQAFDELLLDPETTNVAQDLVAYAMGVSGFGKSLTSFIDIVPTKFLIEIGLIDFQNEIFAKLQEQLPVLQQRFLEQFNRNNPNSSFLLDIDPQFIIDDKDGFLTIRRGSNVSDVVDTEEVPKSVIRHQNAIYRYIGDFTYQKTGKLEGNEYDIYIDDLQSVNPKNNIKVNPAKEPTNEQPSSLSEEDDSKFYEKDNGKVTRIESEQDAIDYLLDNKIVTKFHDKYTIRRTEPNTVVPVQSKEQVSQLNNVQGHNISRLNAINKKFYDKYNTTLYEIKPLGKTYEVKVSPLAIQLINVRPLQLQDDNIVAWPSKRLDTSISSWLNNKGVSVKSVDELKTRTGGDAIAMADILRKAVYVVDGKSNIKTLPEEASHFFFSLIKNSPLYAKYLDLASKSTLYNTVKEQYNGVYDTDEQFQFETAGKLLASAIVENNIYNEQKTLFDKLVNTAKLIWAKVKAIFGKNSSEELDLIINSQFEGLAKDMLSDRYSDIYDQSPSEDAWFELQPEPDSFKRVLKQATNSLKRKLDKYHHQHVHDEYRDELEKIEKQLSENQNVEGFLAFIEQAEKDINLQHLRMQRLEEVSTLVSVKALRDMFTYIQTYDALDTFIGERFKDPRISSLKTRILPLLVKKDEIKVFYLEHGRKKVSEFLYEYGKANPELTPEMLEQMIYYSNKDINMVGTYLSTIGDSKDAILALSAKAIRYNKNEARITAYNAEKRVLGLIEAYEKETGEKGLDVYKGMFEVDSEGNRTGNYVSPTDSKFWRDRAAHKAELEKVYEDEDLLDEAVKRWHNKHKEDPKYKTQYNKLVANKAKFKLFQDLMVIYDEAKAMLPIGYDMYSKMPQIRNSSFERISTAKNVKEAGKSLKKDVGDTILVRNDDTEYGIVDDAGRPISTVPIYYTRYLEDRKDINPDFGHTLIQFYGMATNYSNMSKITAELETIKDLLAERKVAQTRFNTTKTEGITGEPITTKGIESNGYKMFTEYMNMQVYGQMRSDKEVRDILGYKIDLGKVGDAFNRWTALNGLAINLFSGGSNIIIGDIYRLGEAAIGSFYDKTDYKNAHAIYMKNLKNIAVEAGSRNKKSKMGVWGEYMDVLQNNPERVRGNKTYRSNWAFKMFGMNTLFLANNAGEHYLQTITALAMAQKYKLKNGEVVNLWEDAIVENGKLRFKNKNITTDDIHQFIDSMKGVNQYMDGVYSDIDRSIAQKFVLGRVALLFRKFIVPGFERRFKDKRFNYRLGEEQEGTYRSGLKFAKELAKDLKNLEINLPSQWNKLSKMEKANVIRTLNELAWMMGMALLANLFAGWEDEDNEAKKYALYQFHRSYSEISFFVPPFMIKSMFQILKSPAAGVTTTQSLGGMIGMAIQPWDWNERYEHGKRAGELKIGVKFVDLIPVLNKIDDLQDINRQIDYFK